MNTLIVCDSEFGHTAQVARVIAVAMEVAGPVRLVAASEPRALELDGVDLLIVGGPTQRHGLSPAMRAFLDRVPHDAVRGRAAVAFDTRYRMPRLLSGSAAATIARNLTRQGAHLSTTPESFFMERDVPPHGQKRRHEMERLAPGELERARDWAARLATDLASREPGGTAVAVP